MLHSALHYAECHCGEFLNSERRYAERRYAERHGTQSRPITC